MSGISGWIEAKAGKVYADLEYAFEGLLGLGMVYALIQDGNEKSNEAKKLAVVEDIVREIEEPGGIDLPKWFSPMAAKAVLSWVIDKAVATLTAGGFLKGSPPA
jgi:hypothetical protein